MTSKPSQSSSSEPPAGSTSSTSTEPKNTVTALFHVTYFTSTVPTTCHALMTCGLCTSRSSMLQPTRASVEFTTFSWLHPTNSCSLSSTVLRSIVDTCVLSKLSTAEASPPLSTGSMTSYDKALYTVEKAPAIRRRKNTTRTPRS